MLVNLQFFSPSLDGQAWQFYLYEVTSGDSPSVHHTATYRTVQLQLPSVTQYTVIMNELLKLVCRLCLSLLLVKW